MFIAFFVVVLISDLFTVCVGRANEAVANAERRRARGAARRRHADVD